MRSAGYSVEHEWRPHICRIILLLGMFATGCRAAASTPAAPTTSVSTQAASKPVQPTPTAQRAVISPTPTTGPTSTPQLAGDRGVVFGKPVTLQAGTVTVVAVPVMNTSTTVKSFTTKATFKQGDQVVATAVGAINDLLPGEIRSVTLLTQGTDSGPRLRAPGGRHVDG